MRNESCAAALAVALLVPAGCASHERAASTSVMASVDKQIQVAEDPTVFTLFALLNAGGYDDENGKRGMHPVRLEIRRALEAQLTGKLRAEVRAFYDKHRNDADPWAYSVVAKATNGPPDFKPTDEWTRDLASTPQFGPIADLPPMLKRFYREAGVPELYASVRPSYRDYVKAYRGVIHDEVAAALAYCRVPLGELTASGEKQNPLVIPNLLDSYARASSFVLQDRFISVEGPQEKIGYNPHEFLHAVTNPVVYGPATESHRDRLDPLAAEGARALGDDGKPLTSTAAFVDENLVRALSLRYLVPKRPDKEQALAGVVLSEWKQGYVLERFFWEQLAEFEKQGMDLRRYVPAMLAKVDAEAELKRWHDAVKGAAAAP